MVECPCCYGNCSHFVRNCGDGCCSTYAPCLACDSMGETEVEATPEQVERCGDNRIHY